MITPENIRQIAKIGEFEQKEFSIKQTPKSFRVLVSNLYSDCVKAVISELGANCFDSHVEAGKENVPFEICLPSVLEPTFVLRDFGVGMSHSFMMNEYTLAFHSSKDTSNLYNGEKGLGRLSALSVCDSYVCSCFENGVKRTYSIFLNERGVPTIGFFGAEKTDEPNGFVIEIPVPENLLSEFETKAQSVFRYYKVKPIVKNRNDFEFIDNKYDILSQDGSWGLRGEEGGNVPIALMSVYAYPISINAIPGLTKAQKCLLEAGLVIHFELGELNSSASREALEYNEITVASIKRKLDEIIEEIKPVISKEFENKTVFEKFCLASSLFSYNGKFSIIRELVHETIVELKIPATIKLEGFEVYRFTKDYRGKVKKHGLSNLDHVTSNTRFFWAEKKIHLKEKVKQFYDDEHNFANDTIELIFIYSKNQADYDRFYATYGLDIKTLPNAYVLPYDAVNSRGNKSGQRRRCLAFCGYSHLVKRRWEEADFDPQDKIIFVKRQVYACPDYDEFELDQKKRELKKWGYDVVILGLTDQQLAKRQPGWIEFDDYYNQKLSEFTRDHAEAIAALYYLKKHYGDFPEDLLKRLTLDKNTVLYEIYEEWKSLRGQKLETDHYDVKELKVFPWKWSVKDLYEKYPLLRLISYPSHGQTISAEEKQELINYINSK